MQYGVKYKNAGFGFTGRITDSYRLAAAYATIAHGSVYEVGSADDPESATTKPAAAQEENFDDLC